MSLGFSTQEKFFTVEEFLNISNDSYYDGLNVTVNFYENDEQENVCQMEEPMYPSSLGILIAVPEWEAVITAITLTLIILLTVVGNILVILSVFTYKPLRIVQNFFIVSLAVADLTVAILVLPFNVCYSILRRWVFGIHVCKMWLTCDILCCTASILNLCAIALDRYWAITDPINYAQKRTLKRVMMMIVGVWILSGIISSPPLIGWNDWPDVFQNTTPCALTQQRGYVIYSSLGSFYIPLLIMTIVYIEIFIATRRRLRERAKASKINTMNQNIASISQQQATMGATKDHATHDQDSVSSETNVTEYQDGSLSKKSRDKKRKNKKKKKKGEDDKSKESKDKNYIIPVMVQEDSVTENHLPEGQNSFNICDNGNTTTTTTTTKTTTSSTADSPKVKPPDVQASKKPVQVYQFIEEKQRISLSKERRAARTLGIIMGVFVVCWLPFFLMYVILPFCASCCPSEKFINFITWLGYINSALNPIIYTIFNLDFRRAFKKLLHINRGN